MARSNDDLARKFVEECRQTHTILPGATVIERLCADALVGTERRIEGRIAARLDDQTKARLDALLTEMADGKVSRFVWVRQFEVGSNSAGASRLLDRLEFLRKLKLSPDTWTAFHLNGSHGCAARVNGTSQMDYATSPVTGVWRS